MGIQAKGVTEAVKRYPDLRGKALTFIFFLWSLWFLNFVIRLIFSPILPLIEDEFVISHGRASSIFLFQSAGYGLSLLFSGFYSGRLGYKRSIVLSFGVSSVVFFMIPFAKVFSVLYIFSFILGFSTGMYLPSAMSLITEYYAEKDWGRSIAIHDAGSSMSIFCTPFIALFLLDFVKWRGIFGVFGVIFLISAIIFSLVSDEVKIRHSQDTMVYDLLRIRSLWILGGMWSLAAGATIGIYLIIPLYLTKELSLSIEYANTLLGISRIGGVGVGVLASFVIDKINLRKGIFVIMLTTGILTVLVGIAPARLIGIFLFLQAICIIGFFPAGLVSIARMFNREVRGMATGLIMTMSIALGGGLIPYLLGVSGDFLGFGFGILLLGVLVGLSSVLAFCLKELK